jgi:hypothetical protein
MEPDMKIKFRVFLPLVQSAIAVSLLIIGSRREGPKYAQFWPPEGVLVNCIDLPAMFARRIAAFGFEAIRLPTRISVIADAFVFWAALIVLWYAIGSALEARQNLPRLIRNGVARVIADILVVGAAFVIRPLIGIVWTTTHALSKGFAIVDVSLVSAWILALPVICVRDLIQTTVQVRSERARER